MEEAAERAGRTFNAQLEYVINVCMGDRAPHADDGRTEEEWRSLFGQLEYRWTEEEEWAPGEGLCQGEPRKALRSS